MNFSLHQRQLIAASLALSVALGAVGLVLDAAFRQTLTEAERGRLQGHLFTLLAGTELPPDASLQLPAALPEGRFQRPDSGLYAVVVDTQGEVWRSPSTLSVDLPVPPVLLAPGETMFRPPDGGGFLSLSQGVAWEDDRGVHAYTFHIIESDAGFGRQLQDYRRSLWGWLVAAIVLVLAVQFGVLRWSLRPLRQLVAEVRAVEQGRADLLGGRYPAELHELKAALNALLATSRKQLARHRNALADLAHSLKTPLAVLRTEIRDQAAVDQLQRVDEILRYQIQRARASGASALGAPVAAGPLIERTLAALSRLHRDEPREVRCEVGDEVKFFGDEGDLMEVLGNLLDNAFKWATSKVRVGAVNELNERARPGLRLTVEDDGPGIDPADHARLLQRGVRGDERRPGQGIGLAVVDSIVEAYGGTLTIERSSLGGASITIRFP